MWSDISWCHISKYSLRKALSKIWGKFKKMKKKTILMKPIWKIFFSLIVSSIYKLNPTWFPKNLIAAVLRNVYN